MAEMRIDVLRERVKELELALRFAGLSIREATALSAFHNGREYSFEDCMRRIEAALKGQKS